MIFAKENLILLRASAAFVVLFLVGSGCGKNVPELPPSLESQESRYHLAFPPESDTETISMTDLERTVAQRFDREKDNGVVALRLESLETTPLLDGAIPMPGYVIGLLNVTVTDLRSASADTRPLILEMTEGLKLIDEAGDGYYPVPVLNARLKEGACSLNRVEPGATNEGAVVYVLPANRLFISAVYEWNGTRIDIPLMTAPSGPFYRQLQAVSAQTDYLEYTFHAMAYVEMFADQIAPEGYHYLILWTTIRNISNEMIRIDLNEVIRMRQGEGSSRRLVEVPWSLAISPQLQLGGGQGVDGTLAFLVRKSDEALTFHYDGTDGRIEVPLLSDIPVNEGIPLVTPASSEMSQIFVYGYGPSMESGLFSYQVDLGIRNLKEDAVVSVDVPRQFWLEFPGGITYRPLVENSPVPEMWMGEVHVYPNEEERGIVRFIPENTAIQPSEGGGSVVTLVFMSAGGEVRISLL